MSNGGTSISVYGRTKGSSLSSEVGESCEGAVEEPPREAEAADWPSYWKPTWL